SWLPASRLPVFLHSLQFLEVALSEPSQRVPQSLIVGDVHGSPYERCGSEQGWMEPQTPGMEAGADQALLKDRNWRVADSDLETEPVQPEWGEWVESGAGLGFVGMEDSEWLGWYLWGWRGSVGLGWESRDSMSNGAAWITQRCWESKGIMVKQMKHYLGHNCVERPPKYIRYGQEALEHKGGCKRERAIPMGMEDTGMKELPWNFHYQISLSSQSGENSMDGSPPNPVGFCPWACGGSRSATARSAGAQCPSARPCSLAGPCPLAVPCPCPCPLSLSCPLSLGSVELGVAAGPGAVLGENNPEPQLGHFPPFPQLPPSHSQHGPCGSQSPQYGPSHFQLHSVIVVSSRSLLV
uniref:Uncharacterized protein n=1 Tax=Taeniopygia guttata TaxID=59729 RepID=A0A674GTY8_TAEGU